MKYKKRGRAWECRYLSAGMYLCAGVPPQRHVRDRQLGQLPGQARGGAGQDGHASHSLPRPHQYFQQRQVCRTINYDKNAFNP